jgi:hypothetical protein
MEMPPLFSNGVVGQTTSHLVSREADLSIGSLLSRNQSVFGHTSAGGYFCPCRIAFSSLMPVTERKNRKMVKRVIENYVLGGLMENTYN